MGLRETASIYTLVVQRCICVVHLCGVCAILCHLSVRRCCASVHERVPGPKGPWDGDSEPLLPADGVCGFGVVGRVSGVVTWGAGC